MVLASALGLSMTLAASPSQAQSNGTPTYVQSFLLMLVAGVYWATRPDEGEPYVVASAPQSISSQVPVVGTANNDPVEMCWGGSMIPRSQCPPRP